MIVELKNNLVEVMLFFEQPLTERQKENLDYILDELSQLEHDYHEEPN